MHSGEHERGILIDGRYRLGDIIRQSDRSIVYQAEHTGIQRLVEVKTIPLGMAADGVDAARLIREARAAGVVAHRNVQSVVDSGMDHDGRPFIVYEALAGQTVTELLDEHPDGLPTERAAPIVLQLLEGLAAVHAGGVIHRLLGPDSVVVIPVGGGGSLVKLTRFDEAWFVSDGGIAEPPLLRPARLFVPPEGSVADAAPRYDVYAAGVLLRALLTGRADAGRPISDTARRAIERATAEQAEERFPDAQLFLEAVSLLLVSPEGPPREAM
ncbi:MAG: protein kinase, partial [Myxococcota bacterium]